MVLDRSTRSTARRLHPRHPGVGHADRPHPPRATAPWSASSRRRRSVTGGGRRTASALSPTAARAACPPWRRLADAQVSVTFNDGWDRCWGSRPALVELAAGARRGRGFGDFWQHVLVAEGALDVAVDAVGVAPYDLAAPMVVVEQAGGTFTDRHGDRTFESDTAISSNGPAPRRGAGPPDALSRSRPPKRRVSSTYRFRTPPPGALRCAPAPRDGAAAGQLRRRLAPFGQRVAAGG